MNDSKFKVLIADALSPRAIEAFAQRGIDADVKIGLDPDALIAAIGEYDGLAVRSATKVTAQVLEAAHKLKVVGRAGIGVDNIDVPAATARGAVVMNAPFGNAITTAEHAIALMFSLARSIPQADRSTQAGKWEKSRFVGMELSGKTLGIIGCGNIGSIVADRALGLKMRVIAYDPYLSADNAEDLGAEKVHLDELYARADVITLHTPLTEQTAKMIDSNAFAKMKRGVFLVNCARGELLVEADLKAAIESGHVAGAALDVFANEPARENPLFGMAEVISTPHLGASTNEAQAKVAVQIAEQMSDYLLLGAIANAINMPAVSAEEAPRLRPYLNLARQLGSFIGQLAQDDLRAVAVEYEGHVATLNTRPITAIVLENLLAPVLSSVNIVNAPTLAKDHGIDITESKHDRPSAYQTLVRLSVTTDKGIQTVAGTLFAGDSPRLVEITGIQIEAQLGRHMLYLKNQDSPGVIGAVGNALGNAGVNIANFHLGRARQNGEAIALIEVDKVVPEPVLEVVRAIPGMLRVSPLDCKFEARPEVMPT